MVPPHKAAKGYQFDADKFALAGLHRTPSQVVRPDRVAECPIQLEAMVEDVRPFGGAESGVVAVEASVVRTHVVPELMVCGSERHIDPDLWDPLIMKFTHLYGGGRNLLSSRLAQAWEMPPVEVGTSIMAAATWRATVDGGVDRANVFDGAAVTCWRMAAGSSFREHAHHRDELLIVTKGELRFVDGSRARVGDVVEAPLGSVHGAQAVLDTEFFVVEARDTGTTVEPQGQRWSV